MMVDLAAGTTSPFTSGATKTSSYFCRNHHHRRYHSLVFLSGGRERRNVPLSKRQQQQDGASGRNPSSKSRTTLLSTQTPWERDFLWRKRRNNSLREKLLFLSTHKNKHQDADHENVIGIDANKDEITGTSNQVTDKTDAIEEDEGIRELVEANPIGKSVMLVPKSSFLKAAFPYSSGARIVLLCAFCVLGVTAKLFAVNGKSVELKREEFDMVMRKKKSRMNKEKLDKGNVTVLQNAPSLPMASYARPQLDRDELIKCIDIVRMSQPQLESRHEDRDSGAKLKGAKGMLTGDSGAKLKEAKGMLTDVWDHEDRDSGAKLREAKGMLTDVRGHEDRDSGAKLREAKGMLTDARELNVQDCGENGDGGTINDLSSVVHGSNDPTVSMNMDDHEKYQFGLLKQIPSSVENTDRVSNSNVLINLNASRNEGTKQNGIGAIDFVEEESISNTLVYGKQKPKILKSVKKAKEYLLRKHRISVDNLYTRQEGKLKGLEAGVSACSQSIGDKFDVTGSKSNNKNIKTINPSKFNTATFYGDVDSASSPKESIGNQSCKDNDAHFLYSSDNIQGLESQGFSYIDSSSITHAVEGRQSRLDNVAGSKQLNNFLDGYIDSKEQVKTFQDAFGVYNSTNNRCEVNESQKIVTESEKADSGGLQPDARSLKEHGLEKVEFDDNASQLYPNKEGNPVSSRSLNLDVAQESRDKIDMKGLHGSTKNIQLDSAGPSSDSETSKMESRGNWIEDNFQQFDPLIKTVGIGFRENYMLAKEKVQQSIISSKASELGLLGEDEELEWMKDEKLMEIVFQVRDNELAGRDPFHLMDAVDQQAFFKGLELKAEKVNGKLLNLHEWIHTRVENLDYGTDGISLDDPPEKFVPFWKGPAIDKEFGSVHNFTGNAGQSHIVKETTLHSAMKSEESPYSKDVSLSFPVNNESRNRISTCEDTLIECSDGSSRVGKKMGKEHWQHTKKWSQGFLEVYNAETDPEIKSIMKDMGKGLDKWITEKEIQAAGDLMTRIPKRKQRYIQKKMDKLKKEVDMYGAQAVISKYKEYSDEKEEDYLWWLDLQFVLCIELYTVEAEVPKIGFYSLEMATDLELHPAQYHVIAFEDPGDSKKFCYIVQAHMDMLGSGRAFVVAQPPKDAFREAKSNGFNVTVIKKGELKLSVDRTLEEVEKEVTEIGSKIYHDKVMKDRGVDIRSLMTGVVRADRAARRKPKEILMTRAKS